jgi:hypothetical protein
MTRVPDTAAKTRRSIIRIFFDVRDFVARAVKESQTRRSDRLGCDGIGWTFMT